MSRLTLPFNKKSRNIAEFSVSLDDEHRQYSPGDVVKGSIRLRTTKPTRITHIVISLHGFVQVYQTPGVPKDHNRTSAAHLGRSSGKRSGEYFGNGFASLFEDEETLCGDGRLPQGSFQFNFEQTFPEMGLPSSIDFERGTVSYMVTATLTRPTTMSPTLTSERKVYYVERIDVSKIPPPNPRTITLEPISKRSRARTQARKLVESTDKRSRKSNSVRPDSDTPLESRPSSNLSTHTEDRTPTSPVTSDISVDSGRTGAAASQSDCPDKQSSAASDLDPTNGSVVSLANSVITATIESQSGGCLRGDSVPIKINITHTKHVRSLYGVILTLYRQAHVDMHPSIPLGPVEKGKSAKYEDYYPKSVTGLGGLSLTGAGSSHLFRKDLSQVMVPLIVDPQTLTAEINAKIRVPEDSFPTISTVPGEMVSFRYYVEVVLDIQGKLSGQDRNAVGLSGAPSSHVMLAEASNMERSASTPFGSTIIDTSSVRRDKNVVTCTFEVVVGTHESERRSGKRKVAKEITLPQTVDQRENQYPVGNAGPDFDWYESGDYWYSDQWWYYDQQPHPAAGQHDGSWQHQVYENGHHPAPQEGPEPPVPLPFIPDQSTLTEKERVHQAETRLLPSAPPGVEEDVEGEAAEASAPFLPDDGGDISLARPSVPDYGTVPTRACENRGEAASRLPLHYGSTPSFRHVQAGGSLQSSLPATDDKRELQRRELLRASQSSEQPALAPNDDEQQQQQQQQQEEEDEEEQVSDREENEEPGDEAESSAAATQGHHTPTVTAPEETAHDSIHDSHADAEGLSDLPRYEQ